jgi:uncharacterized delta-60 repeat protein
MNQFSFYKPRFSASFSIVIIFWVTLITAGIIVKSSQASSQTKPSGRLNTNKLQSYSRNKEKIKQKLGERLYTDVTSENPLDEFILQKNVNPLNLKELFKTAKSQLNNLQVEVDGTLDPIYIPPAGSGLYAKDIAVQMDGKVLVGGAVNPYIGGSFKWGIFRLNSDGTGDQTFNPGGEGVGSAALDEIRDIEILSDGKILVAGRFLIYNGVSRNSIARLNSDGTLDTSFVIGIGPYLNTTGTRGDINVIKVQPDGKILVGGGFNYFDGVEHHGIVRLNSNGSVDSSFSTGTTSYFDTTAFLVQPDQKIIIGGRIAQDRARLVRLNNNGSVDNTFVIGTGPGCPVEGTFCYVRDLALTAVGKILIFGNFTSYNGTNRQYSARLFSNGSLDASYDPGVGPSGASTSQPSVNTATIQTDGRIIIGGRFVSVSGVGRNNIARLNENGSHDLSFNPGGGVTSSGSFLGVNKTLLQTDNKILIGGAFDKYNGIDRYLSARIFNSCCINLTVSPTSGPQSSTTFVATGSGVTPSASIKMLLTNSDNVQQEVATATSNSSGNVTAYFSTSCLTTPGLYSLQLKDTATNNVSPASSITVTESAGCYLAQTINDISPKTVVLNTRTKLTVYGSNFGQPFTSQVITPEGTFNIGQGDLQYVSPTEVNVWVNMGGTTAYNATLRLDFIRSSVVRSFQVVPSTPTPTIDFVTPSVIANQVATLTIDGSNFQPGFKAFIISPDCSPSCELLSGNKHFLNANQIKLDIVMRGSPPYTATVKIQNPDQQFATGNFQVLVQNQPPSTPLDVIGIEVTQSIQDLQNSVPLIQNKRTYVRVHMRSNTTDIPDVRAQLSATRIANGNRIPLGTRDIIQRTVKQNPSRLTLNDSFLFELPTEWTNGTVELQFRGVSHDFNYREPDGNSDGKYTAVFQTAPQLKIKLVSVFWQSDSGQIVSPSNVEIDEVALDLKRMLPTANIQISKGSIKAPERPSFNIDFFVFLNARLREKRASECGTTQSGCSEYYLGIISLNEVLQGCSSGFCAGGLAAASPLSPCSPDLHGDIASSYFIPRDSGDRFSPVHEIGHLLGRYHTFYDGTERGTCYHEPSDGTIGGGIPLFPYAANWLYGFDGIRTYSPYTPDLMSYGDYRWISKFTYTNILSHIRNRFGSTFNSPDKSQQIVQQGENTTLVSGIILENSSVGELSGNYTFPSPAAIGNTTGNYKITYFDSNGQEIASYNFDPEYSIENNTGSFSLLLPEQTNARRISLIKNGQILASKQASANSPSVSVTYPNGGEVLNGSTVNLQWLANDVDGDSLRFLVQYSSNAGATWETVASDITATSYQLSLDSIAGTNQGLIRVIASDGFRSNIDQSNNFFSINIHAPQPVISSPINNSYFVGDQNIVLSGSAFDLEDGQLNDASLLWSSDLEGSLGSGQNLSINAATLLEGTHNITLTARDSSAQIGTATITIRVYRTQPPIPTTLSASPLNLTFIAQQGTSNLTQPQILAVRNEGVGMLNWVASANQSWINLGSATGIAPSNIEVRINPNGLAQGNYTGTITLATSDAINSPQTVNVSLSIVPYQILPFRVPFDFDGDNKSDIGIFRPSDGSWWYTRSSANDFRVYAFGTGSDIITPGDWTGDGKADISVFRPSNGTWFIQRSEDNSYFSFPFGTIGDVPAPADYDGDGKTDATVFRPSSATWFILNSGGSGTSIVQFGSSEDKPVPADYDGDGKADIAIFRPSDGSWWYLRSSDGSFRVYRFGVGTDKPVPGDYTGDGKADIAIWRPSTGEWFFQRSEDNSYYSVPFGTDGDIPAPGDYDGDGKFDTAVFRPSTATWYVNRTTAGILIANFGSNGDRPIPNAFVP